ncbi:MAG TPA: VOC family protein [bacterium]|nr:VOC family protein [bacterium]
MTKAIPNGYHTLTPSFTFKDCKKAIDFYKKAFNAEVLDNMPGLDGTGTMHATLKIGNSILMMGDEMPGGNCKSAESLGHSPITLYLYVPDADSAFQQAVSAGGEVAMPVADMFWGDRSGTVKDPFGYVWMIATHKKDLTKDQIQQGAKAFFEQMSKK